MAKVGASGGQSQLPLEQWKALAATVGAYIDREYSGVQRRAERGMGISQAHLSAILNPGSRRGPGIATLLKLRATMRVSLDDLLGLEPVTATLSETKRAMREVLADFIVAKRAELDADDEDGGDDERGEDLDGDHAGHTRMRRR